jgi:hypothetical protein
VTLKFNDAVGRKFGFVSVTGPDGKQWNEGAFQVEGSTVTQQLRPLGPKGAYTVAWRVVSADGHPISGTFGFTLTTAGTGPTTDGPTDGPTDEPTSEPTEEPTEEPTGEPSASAAPTTAAAPNPPADSGSSWPMMAGGLVLGAIVLVGLVVGVPTLLRKRRESSVS